MNCSLQHQSAQSFQRSDKVIFVALVRREIDERVNFSVNFADQSRRKGGIL